MSANPTSAECFAHPLSVLLVEDNRADQAMVAAMLKEKAPRVSVTTMADGAAAVDYLMRTGVPDSERPDVVLLDLNLPRKNGFEVLAEIQSEARLRNLPVYMLTTSASREDIERAQALGVRGFLTKPAELDELDSTVGWLAGTEFPKVLAEKNAQQPTAEVPAESFRLLVEAVLDYAIFLLDTKGRIVSWNRGAERTKGYRASEILGKHFSIFYTDEAKQRHHPDYELRTAIEKGAYEEEGLRVRKDGSTFWANVVITALYNKAGEHTGFAKVTRDITDRKTAEENVRRLNAELEFRVAERTRELEASKEELERSNSDLRQFAFIASHDLQEPLRTISTYLQFVKKISKGGTFTPQAEEFIDITVNSALRMRSLVTDLLSYARIEKPSVESEVSHLGEAAQEAISNLAQTIRETGAVVTVGKLPTLAVDPAQMVQVFQNLVGNALTYRREGVPPKIEISAEKGDQHWTISVQDNGIGISRQYFDKIFVIFQRLHGEKERFQGTGIGLAICKKVIERHHGRIWVESEVDHGSIFRFSLPG